jgi:hypothetical protein
MHLSPPLAIADVRFSSIQLSFSNDVTGWKDHTRVAQAADERNGLPAPLESPVQSSSACLLAFVEFFVDFLAFVGASMKMTKEPNSLC